MNSRLTNGIVAFDQKWSTLPAATTWKTPGPRFWSLLIAVYSIFYTWVVVFMFMYVIPNYNVVHLVENVFSVPRVTDFAIMITFCFYLDGLASRFSALNTFWKRLGMSTPETAWTTQEFAVLVECVRLLHADLSDLLRLFNRTYGPVLMAFFSAILLDMALHCFIVMFATEIQLPVWPTVALDVQNVTFMVVVMSCTTWVIKQVNTSIDCCPPAHTPRRHAYEMGKNRLGLYPPHTLSLARVGYYSPRPCLIYLTKVSKFFYHFWTHNRIL